MKPEVSCVEQPLPVSLHEEHLRAVGAVIRKKRSDSDVTERDLRSKRRQGLHFTCRYGLGATGNLAVGAVDIAGNPVHVHRDSREDRMDEACVILVGMADEDSQHSGLSSRDAVSGNCLAAVHRELRAEIKDNGRAAVRCDLHRIAAELMSSPDYIGQV